MGEAQQNPIKILNNIPFHSTSSIRCRSTGLHQTSALKVVGNAQKFKVSERGVERKSTINLKGKKGGNAKRRSASYAQSFQSIAPSADVAQVAAGPGDDDGDGLPDDLDMLDDNMFEEASHTAAHAPSSDMYADDSDDDAGGGGGGAVAEGSGETFKEESEEDFNRRLSQGMASLKATHPHLVHAECALARADHCHGGAPSVLRRRSVFI